MCKQCETVINAGGCAISVGSRNAIVPGNASGTDAGPGTNASVIEKVSEQVLYAAAVGESLRYQRLQHDAEYDYSHPVDDYTPQGMLATDSPAAGAEIQLQMQPDYDMPIRYESVAVLIPAGALTVTLQLGQRTWQLRTQNATADPGQQNPAWIQLPFTGIILNSDDPRILTTVYAGTFTTGQVSSMPHLSMTGYALTRGQFS